MKCLWNGGRKEGRHLAQCLLSQEHLCDPWGRWSSWFAARMPLASGAITSSQPIPSLLLFSWTLSFCTFLSIQPFGVLGIPLAKMCKRFYGIQPVVCLAHRGGMRDFSCLGAEILGSLCSLLCRLLSWSKWPWNTPLIPTLPLPGISSRKCLQMCKKIYPEGWALLLFKNNTPGKGLGVRYPKCQNSKQLTFQESKNGD